MRADRTPHSLFTWLAPPSQVASATLQFCPPSRAGGPMPIYSSERTAQSRRRSRQPISRAMLNEVYNSRILELAGNIPRLGRLPGPDATATAHSKLRGLRETVRRMLKENGSPPTGKWADIAVLEPVRDYKARHASTLLTFDAVTAAIDQIEAKRKAAIAAE